MGCCRHTSHQLVAGFRLCVFLDGRVYRTFYLKACTRSAELQLKRYMFWHERLAHCARTDSLYPRSSHSVQLLRCEFFGFRPPEVLTQTDGCSLQSKLAQLAQPAWLQDMQHTGKRVAWHGMPILLICFAVLTAKKEQFVDFCLSRQTMLGVQNTAPRQAILTLAAVHFGSDQTLRALARSEHPGHSRLSTRARQDGSNRIEPFGVIAMGKAGCSRSYGLPFHIFQDWESIERELAAKEAELLEKERSSTGGHEGHALNDHNFRRGPCCRGSTCLDTGVNNSFGRLNSCPAQVRSHCQGRGQVFLGHLCCAACEAYVHVVSSALPLVRVELYVTS